MTLVTNVIVINHAQITMMNEPRRKFKWERDRERVDRKEEKKNLASNLWYKFNGFWAICSHGNQSIKKLWVKIKKGERETEKKEKRDIVVVSFR